MKNNNPIRVHSRSFAVHKGVTLPEMLVAVAITVGMLAVIGAVFKSASDAAGKANANNDIMQQLRAVTRQIDQDFTGLRPDMPLAILWEAHNNDPDDGARWVRYDRIVFFANGDFQAPNGPGSTGYLSANLARIFYGQSADTPITPPETLNTEPPREILTRRAKLLTADTATGWGLVPGLGSSWAGFMSYWDYDYYPIETETLAFWKNQPFLNYFLYYFSTDPALANSTASFVRRPSINAVQNNYGYDGVQRLYLLPDVTDFKIEVLFPANPAGTGIQPEWFPNEQDVAYIADSGFLDYYLPFYGLDTKAPPRPQQFGFYWNAPLTGAAANVGTLMNPTTTYEVNWRDEKNLQDIATAAAAVPLNLGWNPTNVWPEAIKFTFTLYDKHRRHFPKGQTFSYIVQLPPRP